MIDIQQLNTHHFDPRPEGIVIDTIILHSMYHPEVCPSQQLKLDACIQRLDEYSVSAHYIIDVAGGVWQLVAESARAWHAGQSQMPTDGRKKVNDFSIGIELIGNETTEFTQAQYTALIQLVDEIKTRHPISAILEHAEIAPGRKTDPWGFDWNQVPFRMRNSKS